MKTKHLKAVAAAVSLLIASGPALATSTGLQNLGASTLATDVFQFNCPSLSLTARVNVSDQIAPSNSAARLRVFLTHATNSNIVTSAQQEVSIGR